MADIIDAIPPFDANGNLPPGVYRAAIEEIEHRFTWNPTRRRLFKGLKAALANLAGAGVRYVWINGSFITSKDKPNDIDGCWQYEASLVDVDKLDPVFLDPVDPRGATKKKCGLDFFIAGTSIFEVKGAPVEEFFQVDVKENPEGAEAEIVKGILLVEIWQHHDSKRATVQSNQRANLKA